MTLGELGRLIRGLAQEVRDDRRNYLALQVWEVEKRALEEKDRAKGREIAQLRASIDGIESAKDHEHKALGDRLQALKDDAHLAAEQARKDRAKTWTAIGLALLGTVLSVIGGFTLNSLMQLAAGG
jgi:hypothetical protein